MITEHNVLYKEVSQKYIYKNMKNLSKEHLLFTVAEVVLLNWQLHCLKFSHFHQSRFSILLPHRVMSNRSVV
jgi:hypothetical protein